MIPIMMMMDTPLPIPLSVILSPNHRTNIEPAAMITMDGSWKIDAVQERLDGWQRVGL